MEKVEKTVENKFKKVGKMSMVKGSIITPASSGLCFVVNLTNTAGKTDDKLYAIFDKKWQAVKRETKGFFSNKTGSWVKGTVQPIQVQSDVVIQNLLCQGVNEKTKVVETDLLALVKCLKTLTKAALYDKAGVHVSTLLLEAVPDLKDLLMTHVINEGVNVVVYSEPNLK